MIKAKKIISIITVFTLCAVAFVIPSVTVYAASPKLSKTKLSMLVGKSCNLKLKNASGAVKWVSNKKAVATVSSKGKVTAKKAGSAVITASNKGKKYTCKVTVKNIKAKSISMLKSLTITKGGSSTLKCTIKPSNVTIKKLKWTSSNTKIAGVSSSGKVTGKCSGIATVTAATTDGSKLKLKCTVTVLNKTVDETVKNNLKALGSYIYDKGDTNKAGDFGIFGTIKDEYFDDSYSILYNPYKKMLSFVWYSEYNNGKDSYVMTSGVNFDYSLTAFDYISADLSAVDYERDRIVQSYSADITASVYSYNPDSTTPSIKIKSNTTSISSDKLKNYINSDFKTAMEAFNSLLYSETGLTLVDIGFKNYS